MAQKLVDGDKRHAARAESAEAQLAAGRRGDQVPDEEWRRQERRVLSGAGLQAFFAFDLRSQYCYSGEVAETGDCQPRQRTHA